MKIEFEINEKEIAERVKREVVRQILSDKSLVHETRYGVKNGISEGVKEYIYTHKAEIITDVVNRASKEIVRKSIPKLLEELR